MMEMRRDIRKIGLTVVIVIWRVGAECRKILDERPLLPLTTHQPIILVA
jgi:hypothetical protein